MFAVYGRIDFVRVDVYNHYMDGQTKMNLLPCTFRRAGKE